MWNVRRIVQVQLTMTLASALVTLMVCCEIPSPSPPWPADYSAVLTKTVGDPSNDLVPYMPESPAYVVSYPPVDLTQISLGIQDDYLYVKTDWVGITPTINVHIAANPPIEWQTVGEHCVNVGMDIDNDGNTGFAMGLDLLFKVVFRYGRETCVCSLSDFPPGSEANQTEIEGELGQGGPGYNYSIVRYNLSTLGSLSPVGRTVGVFFWAEAMSFDWSGKELYVHFAFDDAGSTTWTIP